MENVGILGEYLQFAPIIHGLYRAYRGRFREQTAGVLSEESRLGGIAFLLKHDC